MRRDQFRTSSPRLAFAVAVAALTVLVAGCGSNTSTATSATTDPGTAPAGQLRVAAAFYPIAEAVERVGGDRVDVENLTPPGGGPHDLELTPQQVNDLSDMRALFYLSKGFQPQVEKAADGLGSGVRTVDVLDGIDLLTVQEQLAGTQGEVDGEELEGGYDPHIWVDPVLQAEIATHIRDVLVDLDPDGRATFDAGLATYKAELTGLDADFETGLATCDSKVIVTSHRAFKYLARRYGLTQIAIAGLSPDEEPDPRTLEAVAEAAREHNVQVVFFEEQVPADLSETVANEIGASTRALDPVETITAPDLDAGATYETVMRANLAALTQGLGCR